MVEMATSVSASSPIYSALSNPNGAPGDVMFRRTAYDYWQPRAIMTGFVPYVSGQYSQKPSMKG